MKMREENKLILDNGAGTQVCFEGNKIFVYSETHGLLFDEVLSKTAAGKIADFIEDGLDSKIIKD